MSAMGTISYSEIQSLNRCEKLWSYEYARGYVPLRVDAKLGRGTIMHALFAALHTGEDWDARWAQLRAGAIDAAILTEEVEAVMEEFDLYHAIMERYLAWDLASMVPLAVEQPFLIELPVGGTLKIKPDLIYKAENGTLVLRDYKTTDDFDRDLELRSDFDPQLSVYAWGLRRLGYDIRRIEYVYLRMRLPAVPKINKDGTMSKVYVITDEETVREFVATSGVKIAPDDLEAYIAKLPQDAFFRRIEIVRTNEELDAISREIMAKMLRRDRLASDEHAPTRTLIHDCVRCPFLRPCIVNLKGGDEEVLLAEFYRKRKEDSEISSLPIDYEEGEVRAATDA